MPEQGTHEAHRLLTGPKDLITIPNANHIDFYDNAPVVNKVTETTVAWFHEHL